MKKLIFALVSLSSISLAKLNVFDFDNTKPISQTRLETSVDLRTELDTYYDTKFVLEHSIGGQTNIYEFLKLKGDLKYSVDFTESKHSSKLEKESMLGVYADFKEYGTIFSELKQSKEFVLGYKNKVKFNNIKGEGEIGYLLDFSGKELAHKGQGEIKVIYLLLDHLDLFAKAKVKADFANKTYDPEAAIGAEYINGIKSLTMVEYKNSSVNIYQNLGYEIKEDVLNVRHLSITPEGEAKISISNNGEDVEFYVIPRLGFKYKAKRGVVLDGGLHSKIRFEKRAFDAFGYKGIDTGVKLGIRYYIN